MSYKNWRYLVYWKEEDGEHCKEFRSFEEADREFTEKVQQSYATWLCRFLPGEDYYWDGEEITIKEAL